ncbi:helix-turn-helix domain-containing protein [Vagococcus fluvialis]|uniref:Helix-turn-helix transcriptional regulator n=1 Tax=Vagococcus fluvialis TaxID=2738 RepID=A0A7X6D7Q7_9ENTE|nr:helix-turn-helix transcriptional regulator [Vagococcus fluvialis]NKC67357.1 helix-turn-helix transcriptional regulator [Vagococcus fluvialis]
MEKKVIVCLKELVEDKGISLRELARLSDIEPSIINKLANNKHERIYLPHIERIAESLDIDDISLILKIIPKDTDY